MAIAVGVCVFDDDDCGGGCGSAAMIKALLLAIIIVTAAMTMAMRATITLLAQNKAKRWHVKKIHDSQ